MIKVHACAQLCWQAVVGVWAGGVGCGGVWCGACVGGGRQA